MPTAYDDPDAPRCAVCGQVATWKITDAPEDKGNHACDMHRRMWPLSKAERLDNG